MVKRLRALIWLTALSASVAAAGAEVTDYRLSSGFLREQGNGRVDVALRQFQQGRLSFYLAVRPESLDTVILPAKGQALVPAAWDEILRAIGRTAYGRALTDAEKNSQANQDAGITHFLPAERGVNLTIDLCPSRNPLDRQLFTQIVAAFAKVERPVPLAVAISGLWMEEHPADLEWLRGLVAKGEITVDWINHSYHHQFNRRLPLLRNFLLEKGVEINQEIELTEKAMIEKGLIPSVFFRFPGLVSDRRIFQAVVEHGLIPVGSDAWLAKDQTALPGSIVLIHGNGNEPLGIDRFLELVRTERAAIKSKNWLLFDLRQSLVQD